MNLPHSSLYTAFVQLRKAWLSTVLKRYSMKPESEDKNATDSRGRSNKEIIKAYNDDTEAILNGESYCIAPTSSNDIGPNKLG